MSSGLIFTKSAMRFRLDNGHEFERDRPLAVCRNTARMVSQTRLGKHFTVTPEIKHFGLFDCGPTAPSGGTDTAAACC